MAYCKLETLRTLTILAAAMTNVNIDPEGEKKEKAQFATIGRSTYWGSKSLMIEAQYAAMTEGVYSESEGWVEFNGPLGKTSA